MLGVSLMCLGVNIFVSNAGKWLAGMVLVGTSVTAMDEQVCRVCSGINTATQALLYLHPSHLLSFLCHVGCYLNVTFFFPAHEVLTNSEI